MPSPPHPNSPSHACGSTLTPLKYSREHTSFLFKTAHIHGSTTNPTHLSSLSRSTGLHRARARLPKLNYIWRFMCFRFYFRPSFLPLVMSCHHSKAQALLDSKPQFKFSFSAKSFQNPALNPHSPRPEEIPSFLKSQAHLCSPYAIYHFTGDHSSFCTCLPI